MNQSNRHPFLAALGERARVLRARRGMTRRSLAKLADVSDRHLANLEYGIGNPSILVLHQISQALDCSIAELVGDVTTASPEWLMIRELLAGKDEATLQKARHAITSALGGKHTAPQSKRVALIGLRGAGKSSLGARLAQALDLPFVELSREIEAFAGCTVGEIQALYGANAYRRYERRALEEAIQIYPEAVIATPGGIVSEPSTLSLLLEHCTTVWLKATPEDHMQRVIAQGDMRPMSDSKEAMTDLRNILIGRSAFYAKANLSVDTSAQDFEETLRILQDTVTRHIGLESTLA